MSLMKPIFVALRLGKNTFTSGKGQLSKGMLTMLSHVAVEILLRAEAGEQFLWFGKFLFHGRKFKMIYIRYEKIDKEIKSLTFLISKSYFSSAEHRVDLLYVIQMEKSERAELEVAFKIKFFWGDFENIVSSLRNFRRLIQKRMCTFGFRSNR